MDPQDGPGTRWWTWVNGHTFHTQNSNTISRCQNAKVRMLAWGCACKHIYCHFRAAFHLKFTVQILPQHFQDPVLLSRAAEMTGKWQCLHSPYAAVHGVRLPFELLLLPTTLIPVYCAIQRLFPMTFPAVVKKGKTRFVLQPRIVCALQLYAVHAVGYGKALEPHSSQAPYAPRSLAHMTACSKPRGHMPTLTLPREAPKMPNIQTPFVSFLCHLMANPALQHWGSAHVGPDSVHNEMKNKFPLNLARTQTVTVLHMFIWQQHQIASPGQQSCRAAPQ